MSQSVLALLPDRDLPTHPVPLSTRATKTEANCHFLRERLRHLIRDTSYFGSQRRFLDDLAAFHSRVVKDDRRGRYGINGGDISLNENTLSKFLSGDDSKINAADFRLIVHFLDTLRVLNPDNQGELMAAHFGDPLFHALLHFLRVSDTTLDNIKSVAPGLYRAWRPSSTFPGHYWKGTLKVWLDPDSAALKTHESYAAVGIDGRRDRYIDFSGYLVRKDYQYTIVSRNNDLTSLQVAFLPQASKFNNQLHTLAGFVTDMTTARLYTSRVFYDLIHPIKDLTPEIEAAQVAGLAVIAQDDVPDSILAFFEQRQPSNIVLF